jgi:hypothetical protein
MNNTIKTNNPYFNPKATEYNQGLNTTEYIKDVKQMNTINTKLQQSITQIIGAP